MPTPFRSLFVFAAVVAVALALSSCGVGGAGNDSTTTVSGTILNEGFTATSGTAERSADSITITLADSSFFDCDSQPSGPYMTVVLDDIPEGGTYDAAGKVGFNAFQNGVGDSEAATAGSFTLEILDDETGERIQGTISAQGPTSQVNGSFEVPVCS